MDVRNWLQNKVQWLKSWFARDVLPVVLGALGGYFVPRFALFYLVVLIVVALPLLRKYWLKLKKKNEV